MNQRLISLDALRGFTIAAMVIVNNPGTWASVYPPLLHVEWNGATPTDFIFPFFVFIVGVSIVLAYSKQLEQGREKGELGRKIVWRAVKIFALGLFLWLYPNFNFPGIRWVGVLQRIAIVFMVCAFLFLYTDWRKQAWIGGGLLVGYWILMDYVPVPGIGAPDLSVAEKNWAHYLDDLLLPGRLWKHTWDPEGLLSTLPAIGTGISGMLAGHLILGEKDPYRKVAWLFFGGFAALLVGGIWGWEFPINKNIWTSSFVLVTSGFAAMGLAASMLLCDIKGVTGWTALGRIYGANAITAYVLAGVVRVLFYKDVFGMTALNRQWMDAATGAGMAGELASLLYAIFYMLVIFLPVWWLYRKKIFLKV